MSYHIKTAQIEWQNNKQPVSARFDDPYYSIQDGLEESRYVFLTGNGLPDRFADGFHIAELGFGTGFWAIFVTMAAEQFGTNLRATAATTIPNMVRGALPLIILLFNWLQNFTNYAQAGLITGIIVMAISVVAVWFTEETFHKDLNYIEY